MNIQYCKFIIVSILALPFLLPSCQKEIPVTLPDYKDKLIVDGYIENDAPAIVILSKNLPYFSTVNLDTLLEKMLISNATVTITSSSGETEQLVFMPAPNESPYYSAYKGRTIIGEENKTYTLKIELNGKTYMATTSISQTFDMDSIWKHKVLVRKDSLGVVRAKIKDDNSGDKYYRIQVKVQGKKIQDRCWGSMSPAAFDNHTFMGADRTIEIKRDIPVTLFIEPEDEPEDESKRYHDAYFYPGDTVSIKYSRIDYGSFRFWRSINGALEGENPFISPTPTVSNIEGTNVLGVWCGYASKTTILYFE